MSKISLVVGFILSVALHAALFWPLLAPKHEPQRLAEDQRVRIRVNPAPAAMPEPAPAESRQVAAATPQPEPPPPRPEPEPEPEPPPRAKPQPMKSQPVAPPPPALQEVVRASALPAPGTATSAAGAEQEDAGLPTLRIEWSSPEQVKAVVQALGMRIVAVDAANGIVGEVQLAEGPSLVEFGGQLAAYSNRVRTLSRDYFGAASGWPGGEDIRGLWILVPAEIDQAMAEIQRQAVRESGRDLAEVGVTEGHFEQIEGAYSLVITNII